MPRHFARLLMLLSLAGCAASHERAPATEDPPPPSPPPAFEPGSLELCRRIGARDLAAISDDGEHAVLTGLGALDVISTLDGSVELRRFTDLSQPPPVMGFAPGTSEVVYVDGSAVVRASLAGEERRVPVTDAARLGMGIPTPRGALVLAGADGLVLVDFEAGSVEPIATLAAPYPSAILPMPDGGALVVHDAGLVSLAPITFRARAQRETCAGCRIERAAVLADGAVLVRASGAAVPVLELVSPDLRTSEPATLSASGGSFAAMGDHLLVPTATHVEIHERRGARFERVLGVRASAARMLGAGDTVMIAGARTLTALEPSDLAVRFAQTRPLAHDARTFAFLSHRAIATRFGTISLDEGAALDDSVVLELRGSAEGRAVLRETESVQHVDESLRSTALPHLDRGALLALSPAGDWIAQAGNGVVFVQRARADAPLVPSTARYPHGSARTTALALSAGGARAAVGDDLGRVFALELASVGEVVPLWTSGAARPIAWLSIAPDASQLALHDGSAVVLLDAATGEARRLGEGSTGAVPAHFVGTDWLVHMDEDGARASRTDGSASVALGRAPDVAFGVALWLHATSDGELVGVGHQGDVIDVLCASWSPLRAP